VNPGEVDMNSKTAVITGASGGIGLELARQFAIRGYRLILVARSEDKLWRLAEDLNRLYGISAEVVRMDLTQPGAAEALWRAVLELTAQVDVLVNNAGVGDAGDFAHEDPQAIERMIQLNVTALTAFTRCVLPGMLDRKRGRILNVSSLAGFQPGGPGMAVYYASKSYVLSFSRALNRELRGSGVTVTALCPGATRTGFEAAAGAEQTRLFQWTTPMEAREVAEAGYRGLMRGSPVVVPGWLNKLLSMTWLSPDFVSLEINRFLLGKRE
jgi:short-subunit dehydrogenase